jgi:hypothetical protein
MKLYLKVVADCNDGDYVETLKEISPKNLEKLKPLIVAIKEFKPYTTKTEDGEMDWRHNNNYPVGDCQRKDLGEKSADEIYKGVVSPKIFEMWESEYLPQGQYGIHTIDTVEVIEVGKIEKIL